MFQNSRLNELLEYFLTHKEYVTSSKLVRHFDISERTLRNDIRVVNEELQKYGAQLLMKRKEGYYLQLDDPSAAELLRKKIKAKKVTLDSVDRRINYLIIKMLYADTYLTQDDLADEVYVSTNTIINYLKTIRLILSKYKLTLKTKANLGYLVIGDELSKRRCIIEILTSTSPHSVLYFSDEQNLLLNHVNLDMVKKIVMDFNQRCDLHFSDYNLKNLILHIALSISRLQAGWQLESYHIPDDPSLSSLLDPLIAHMEVCFQTSFTRSEKNYIYSHYISNTKELLDQRHNADYIHKLVDNILHYIYESYHIDLRSDMILVKDLGQHLQSILSAKYYQLNQKNPLLNTIRTNYILAYEITETAVYQTFENEPVKLYEDEIGYIALHIGAAMERYFESCYTHHKKTIIVYENGYAEGSFLAAKITSLFKDTLEIVGRYPSHELASVDFDGIDLIVSTVSLRQIDTVPVVVVEIPLLRKDIENLAKAITKEHVHPIDKIRHFFSPSLFINTSVRSRDEIIHTLCTLLRENVCVTDAFEASVLERETRISTAMDGVVALPHPMTICSKKSQIAIGILKEPIKWSEKDNAQIILMLALADDGKKNIKDLYDTFVAITYNTPLQNLLLRTESLEEFLQILKENIPEDAY